MAVPALRNAGVLPVSCGIDVCEAMADKQRADEVFRSLGLRVPVGARFPIVAKPRFGASSRGIVKLHDAEELEFWRRRNRVEDFLLQAFIAGTEYSVDGYVDGRGRTLGIVSRVRQVVAEGEVMVTRTEHQPEAEAMTSKLLTWGSWHGPFTVQLIHDGRDTWLLECNPRFGSGVTCSIEAGLAIPDWILRECLRLPLPDVPISWQERLCMTRSRRDHFVWLSEQ
jgi:carbamoylphosphate synthase large subunit